MFSGDASTLTSINQTALLVALRRAVESCRQDALFHDILAESVAEIVAHSGMSPKFWSANEEMAQLSGDAVALRTRHYDDQIDAAVRRGVRQIVLLGVGLDGRSCRLNFDSSTQLFEVDQPAILHARENLLVDSGIAPKYDRKSIAADLPADDLSGQLCTVGFRSDRPSVFVAEGLLFYLNPADVERLVFDIGSLAAPGSLLLADYPAGRAVTTVQGVDEPLVTEDFKRQRVDPWTMFTSANWRLECRTLNGLARTYGRSLPADVDEQRGGARWWYSSAVRI